MTAEPIAGNSCRWPVPPQDGYTVDDLFTLPNLPPHTELLDGSLVFVSPQRVFHSRMIDLLMNGLRSSAPSSVKALREMTVVLDRRNGPEPDVSVVRAEAVTGPELTRFQAADVLLAIEVVSPDSEARDREAKPQKYAAAGIPNFWLVEMTGTDLHPVVRVYELDPLSKTYALSGVHRDRVKTDVPFQIDIDITSDALNRL
ncbi:Uma2 family endonuclease [Streptomyces sp. AM 4-1-1]|uniref:Uma2 family endonuclease n=1 Tax=unclassified Streptomyces TaxID=2593676 RepID=UPI0023B8DD43|nr:Uma2 family endonuclease [Streptomyces sp. AM 4-1-1]WEH37486.1 Uma2 family endonuclease [Streptomyces sp. AM 4-1-1]